MIGDRTARRTEAHESDEDERHRRRFAQGCCVASCDSNPRVRAPRHDDNEPLTHVPAPCATTTTHSSAYPRPAPMTTNHSPTCPCPAPTIEKRCGSDTTTPTMMSPHLVAREELEVARLVGEAHLRELGELALEPAAARRGGRG